MGIPDQPVSPPPERSFCRILNWRVFEPGFHKGRLYTTADCHRMARNFQLLSAGPNPVLVPVAALGHDPEGRFMASLGFPNVGRVVRDSCTPDGAHVVDLDRVPVDVGGEVSAGRLNSGSIELVDRLPHPRDQSRVVRGPILTGVALLGEEQPQLKGFAPPRAVFPDGTPVPPNPSAARWLDAMAAVRRSFAAGPRRARPVRYLGREFAASTIAFSEMFSMDRATILDQLRQLGIPVDDPSVTGRSDDELRELLNNLVDSGFTARDPQAFAAARPAFAALAPVVPRADPRPAPGPGDDDMTALDGIDADHTAPPAMRAMARAFRGFAATCTRRFGALEAATSAGQDGGGDGTMATFSAAVQAARGAALTRREVELYLAAGRAKAAEHRVFAAGPDNGLAPLAALTAEVEALPVHATLRDEIDLATPGDAADDPFVRRALARLLPRTAGR